MFTEYLDARRGLGAAGSLTKAAVPENRLGSADGGDGERGMGLQVGLTCFSFRQRFPGGACKHVRELWRESWRKRNT